MAYRVRRVRDVGGDRFLVLSEQDGYSIRLRDTVEVKNPRMDENKKAVAFDFIRREPTGEEVTDTDGAWERIVRAVRDWLIKYKAEGGK